MKKKFKIAIAAIVATMVGLRFTMKNEYNEDVLGLLSDKVMRGTMQFFWGEIICDFLLLVVVILILILTPNEENTLDENYAENSKNAKKTDEAAAQ